MSMIENPGSPVAQAIFLKAHLKMLVLGMRNSRLSGTKILAKVTAITGNEYKCGQYNMAIGDLEAIIKG